MKTTQSSKPYTEPARENEPRASDDEIPRLNLELRHWLVTLVLVLAIVMMIPPAWKRLEQFSTPPDYRIPYALSNDYWLYERRLHRLRSEQIPLLGDSVIWGEYVTANGTLSHFLNEESEQSGLYVNAGLNGLFPLALEGLVRYYGRAIHDQKVILHCNLLWLSSPEADLSSRKERKFNHVGLVPQFMPDIPSYRASANDRISLVLDREVPLLSWVGHLQNAYFDHRNLYAWTLADDGQYPPSYPNAMANPWRRITFKVPDPPASDPDRGIGSARHKPWSTSGIGTQQFQWVALEKSLQWRAFKRLALLLRGRGNEVLVILGPFNTHMMAPENKPRFEQERELVQKWLAEQRFAAFSPPPLKSRLYGDASHPLTAGYQILAGQILADKGYRDWLATGEPVR